MQLKYSLKKEWSLFARTFRMGGVIIAIFGFLLAYPLLFKFTGVLLNELDKNGMVSFAALFAAPLSIDIGVFGDMGISEVAAMYFDAEIMYSATIMSVCTTATLVIMLVLMPAAGGEQKKRAMIVPMCTGMKIKSYLLSKFIIYPASCFVLVFFGSLLCGGFCNLLFPNNHLDGGLLVLSSLLAAIFVVFVVCVYFSLGLCTSRPGIMSALVYIVISILNTMLNGLHVNQFQPLGLVYLIDSKIFLSEDFTVESELANILVSSGTALVISVLMFFLAFGVLKAKRINNRREKKPEF